MEEKNENIITRRMANIIQVGTTLAIVLRKEFEIMNINKGDQVVVTLTQVGEKNILKIEKA